MNFTETVSVTISPTEIPHCFINGKSPSLSICPADQQFRQTKNNCSVHCLLPLCQTWQRHRMPKRLCDCRKSPNKIFCFFVLWNEFSSLLWILQKSIVSVKDNERLVHLLSCGQSTLSWAGSRMGSAAQFVNWNLPILFLINIIFKCEFNCYGDFTTPVSG